MASKKKKILKDVNLKLYEDDFLNNISIYTNHINELGKTRNLNDTISRYAKEGMDRDLGLNTNIETNDLKVGNYEELKEVIDNQNEEIIELKEMIVIINNKRVKENEEMNKRLDMIIGMLERGNTIANDVVNIEEVEEVKPQRRRNKEQIKNLLG